MNQNIVHQISKNDIKTFITQIISKLSAEKHFFEIFELKKILAEFDTYPKFPKISSKLLKLITLQKNNPIIQILLSLNLEEVKELKSIPAPPIFADFFEELDFYIILNTTSFLPDPVEKIDHLIRYAKKFININDHIPNQNKVNKAIKLLNLAKTITDTKPVQLQNTTRTYNILAKLYLKIGYENEAIRIWLKNAYLVSNFDMLPFIQLETFQKTARHLSRVKALDEITEIIKIILMKPHFWNQKDSSTQHEEPIIALQRIFEQIIECTDIPSALCVIQKIKNALEFYGCMDLALEKLCKALLVTSLSFSDLITLTQSIRNESVKQRIFKQIYQKFLAEHEKKLVKP